MTEQNEVQAEVKNENEDEIIFKALAALRNRAKKLSPQGRERLFAMVKTYVG